LRRGQLALYAVAALSGAALAASAFLLTTKGAPPIDAITAAVAPSLVLGFIGLASRYLCRAMPIHSSSRGTIAAAVAGSAAAASGLWVLIWKWWIALLGRPLAPDYTLLFGLGVLLYLATVAVQYLILELDASREAESEALRFRVLAREAELRAFKAQVDPHFLFNSLNAVASLCGSRPNEAREMAQLMADFFRLTLRIGARDRITLAEEIELVSRYLAIERVRFGARLATRIDVDDAAAACLVPPLVLQPLVENAVRHGIASMVDGGTISIDAWALDGMLRIEIMNPADPDREHQRGEGIGLQNARGRLVAINGTLDTHESNGLYVVTIEVPL